MLVYWRVWWGDETSKKNPSFVVYQMDRKALGCSKIASKMRPWAFSAGFFPMILRALGHNDLIVKQQVSRNWLDNPGFVLDPRVQQNADLADLHPSTVHWTRNFHVFWCRQVPDALRDWNIYHPKNIPPSHVLIVVHSYWTYSIHWESLVDASEILGSNPLRCLKP